MTGHQTWLKNNFWKNCQVQGVFQPSSPSATDLTNVLNGCLQRICWVETLLSLKISNSMSGDQAEVKKKKTLFWPPNLLPGLTHMPPSQLFLPTQLIKCIFIPQTSNDFYNLVWIKFFFFAVKLLLCSLVWFHTLLYYTYGFSVMVYIISIVTQFLFYL